MNGLNGREILCPRCGKPSLFTPENPFRPFCSERCKLIDLGNWAEGRYTIPIASAADGGLDESENPDTGRDSGEENHENASESAVDGTDQRQH